MFVDSVGHSMILSLWIYMKGREVYETKGVEDRSIFCAGM